MKDEFDAMVSAVLVVAGGREVSQVLTVIVVKKKSPYLRT